MQDFPTAGHEVVLRMGTKFAKLCNCRRKSQPMTGVGISPKSANTSRPPAATAAVGPRNFVDDNPAHNPLNMMGSILAAKMFW